MRHHMGQKLPTVVAELQQDSRVLAGVKQRRVKCPYPITGPLYESLVRLHDAGELRLAWSEDNKWVI